jgi:hypothetical protein
MAWLTVRLAESNHLGQSEVAWEKELVELSEALLQEAAPQVCHANLHMAVARTNQYAFARARAPIARWAEVPPAVPGLRMWGQVQSSLGQHAAFLGEPRKAVEFFQKAIHAFECLSDADERKKEIAQTRCYLAIALMDDPSAPDDGVRSAVEQVTGPLASAAEEFAQSGEEELRYAHHLFLRWLVRRGDAALAARYVAKRADWKTGEGHPWPLILLYRALLLKPTDSAAARDLAMHAALWATEPRQGPVVRLIGACCRAVARSWGEPWDSMHAELTALDRELPAAAGPLATLRTWSGAPGPLLEMLETVLPFNFH